MVKVEYNIPKTNVTIIKYIDNPAETVFAKILKRLEASFLQNVLLLSFKFVWGFPRIINDLFLKISSIMIAKIGRLITERQIAIRICGKKTIKKNKRTTISKQTKSLKICVY